MDALRLPGFQSRRTRARSGKRPSDTRRVGRSSAVAHDRAAFAIARTALGFGVFQWAVGTGCCRLAVTLAERSRGVQAAPLERGMESLLRAVQGGLSLRSGQRRSA